MQAFISRRIACLAVALASLSSEVLPRESSLFQARTFGEECGCCSEFANEIGLTVHVVSGSGVLSGSRGVSCSGDVMVSCSQGSGCHSDEYVMHCLFSGVHSHRSSRAVIRRSSCPMF